MNLEDLLQWMAAHGAQLSVEPQNVTGRPEIVLMLHVKHSGQLLHDQRLESVKRMRESMLPNLSIHVETMVRRVSAKIASLEGADGTARKPETTKPSEEPKTEGGDHALLPPT